MKLLIVICLGIFILGSVNIIAGEFPPAYTQPNALAERLGALSFSEETIRTQKNLVRWYHINLKSADPDPGFEASYGDILNLAEGAMGTLSIPSMGICLPIYHGTGEDGAGHLMGTAFPLGLQGTHSGLQVPFSLEEGTFFYVDCLDAQTAYRVEQTGLRDKKDLCWSGREGEALCTLVVPFGDRVLGMEGVSVESAPAREEIRVTEEQPSDRFTVAVCLLLALGIILVPLLTRWEK